MLAHYVYFYFTFMGTFQRDFSSVTFSKEYPPHPPPQLQASNCLLQQCRSAERPVRDVHHKSSTLVQP